MKWFQKCGSLNKIFHCSVYCCKNSKKGKDYCKNRFFETHQFIKFYTTPGCNKNYAYHLECYACIFGVVFYPAIFLVFLLIFQVLFLL